MISPISGIFFSLKLSQICHTLKPFWKKTSFEWNDNQKEHFKSRQSQGAALEQQEDKGW